MGDNLPTRTNRILAWTIAILGLCVLLSVGLVGWLYLRDGAAAWQALRGPGSNEHIAFVSGTLAEGLDLYLADAHGEKRVNLSPSRGDEIFPAWSPDGKKLAYCRVSLLGQTSGPRAADAGAYLLDVSTAAEGRRPAELLYAISDGVPRYPAWSPDGARIALVATPAFDDSGRPTATETLLVVIDVVTHQQQEHVLPLLVTVQDVDWSAGGSALALVGMTFDAEGKELERGVYVYELDSRTMARIAPTATDVAWSPTGELLACANPDDSPGLVLLNADGSPARTLEDTQWVTSMAWSPDGAQLIYGRASRTGYALALCDVATGETSIVLDALSGAAEYATWSLSGALVAYTIYANATDDLQASIGVVDMRTHRTVPFASEHSIEGMAVWQPMTP